MNNIQKIWQLPWTYAHTDRAAFEASCWSDGAGDLDCTMLLKTIYTNFKKCKLSKNDW